MIYNLKNINVHSTTITHGQWPPHTTLSTAEIFVIYTWVAGGFKAVGPICLMLLEVFVSISDVQMYGLYVICMKTLPSLRGLEILKCLDSDFYATFHPGIWA